MSVLVAGRPVVPWCAPDRLVGLSGAWTNDANGTVVCEAPGVYVVDGAVRFVLPRCYPSGELDGHTARRAALILLRSLSRYRMRPEHHAVDEDAGEVSLREVGAVDDALAWLETALLLAEDAQRNGALYVTTNAITPNRQGRIHWAKTQHHGFHVVDGAEVMTSPLWRSRHGIDPEDLLTQLHLDTCATIRAALGRGAEGGRHWTPAEALSVLDRRERSLFADRHRLVARWLRQYWTGSAGAAGSRRSGVCALWSPNFPMVWEAMLRDVMGGRSFGMPRGSYIVGSGLQRGMRLVPDFAMDADGLRLIVDAKHYGIDRLPGTESLAKQLLYRWFASKESGHGDIPLAKVVSIFMLPAVGRKEAIDVLGAHELDGEARLPHAFGRVWVMAADFETVAEAYGDGRSTPDLMATVRSHLSLDSV